MYVYGHSHHHYGHVLSTLSRHWRCENWAGHRARRAPTPWRGGPPPPAMRRRTEVRAPARSGAVPPQTSFALPMTPTPTHHHTHEGRAPPGGHGPPPPFRRGVRQVGAASGARPCGVAGLAAGACARGTFVRFVGQLGADVDGVEAATQVDLVDDVGRGIVAGHGIGACHGIGAGHGLGAGHGVVAGHRIAAGHGFGANRAIGAERRRRRGRP